MKIGLHASCLVVAALLLALAPGAIVQQPIPTLRENGLDQGDDGTFYATLTAPDMMEMCRTEITFNSHLVGCRQLTRQK